MMLRSSALGVRWIVLPMALALVSGLLLARVGGVLAHVVLNIAGPTGSDAFGASVTVLTNGNIVVVDKAFDAGDMVDVGAVYLYHGATRQLISTFVGSQSYDLVGSDGVTLLNNGHYVITSPYWSNGEATNAGAVTWCSGTVGCKGPVSSANSLVGGTAGDRIGLHGVSPLSNGSYLVHSAYWDNGVATDAGALTWCSGLAICAGTVSPANSLVGGSVDDWVGFGTSDFTELNNGGYVVQSPYWTNGGIVDAGAATWCSGTGGCSGPISAANSLVGSTVSDHVGSGITTLNNGNYIVSSAGWDNGGTVDAGSATWCDGTAACVGIVSAANSLVGNTANDQISASGVLTLTNGNYVVGSQYWDNGSAADAGAATWCSGTVGCTGVVSPANSLVGSTASDMVPIGGSGLVALNNGNYTVLSPNWDSGVAANVGSVTWCSGTVGCSGPVTPANSLVGTTAFDAYGPLHVTQLTNGNYVVVTSGWDNGDATNAGAATWCSGTAGCSGPISPTNSLVGTAANNEVGYSNVTPLSNGNYVVQSWLWDDGAMSNVGAMTWCNGTTGCTGPVSALNSLVGSQPGDIVGDGGARALSNGNYVVSSPNWDNGGAANAGASTWCSGVTGCSGMVSLANSLVGSTAMDQVGASVTLLSSGSYVVGSQYWDSAGVVDAGAVTWCSGTAGCTGPVSSANSLVGSTANDQLTSIGITLLTNGNYVVRSPTWDSASAIDAGAVTWCAGTAGCIGTVSALTSLVGTSAGDQVGFGFAVTAQDDGNYVVHSRYWDNGSIADAGAVTLGDGTTGATGPITVTHSVLGASAFGGQNLVFDYGSLTGQLVVGRPAENVVSLLEPESDVGIAKAVTPTRATSGAAITYTLSFSNTGPGAAQGVVISDRVPAALTVTSVTSSTLGSGVVITQTSGGPDFSWAVTNLGVGAGGAITLTGTLDPGASIAAGVITNTATITASTDITTSNNSASAVLTVIQRLYLPLVRRGASSMGASVVATWPTCLDHGQGMTRQPGVFAVTAPFCSRHRGANNRLR